MAYHTQILIIHPAEILPVSGGYGTASSEATAGLTLYEL